tara:strand:- start:53 stop:1594 length:1542 start_codon:yes stop_codon:yes gene_type:complete
MPKKTFNKMTQIENIPLMVLGTSSGAGKTLITTAICRSLKRRGGNPIPFKGQNMSNNAWVDNQGREMAYSQALQAWAAGLEPSAEMNPVLLKPKGDCTSEVIHLGKSIGTCKAVDYYKNCFKPGWEAIKKGINILLEKQRNARLILEGAGSPVEVNLQHKDLTNLKLAKFLKANCILVADIERGGVFAQIIGTISLMEPEERKLIKGIIINRFRGDKTLFKTGVTWIEQRTSIPVLGILPWLEEIFPAEDSLDLLEKKPTIIKRDIEVAVIKLPSISNFSDLDPLETESSISLKWVRPGEFLGTPHAVIIPGSKQTLKDLEKLKTSGLGKQIKEFAKEGGIVFGICGGLQILGKTLEDPSGLEHLKQENSTQQFEGLNLLPIRTLFKTNKSLSRIKVKAIWPCQANISGFELHHGVSEIIDSGIDAPQPIFENNCLGWRSKSRDSKNVAGTYLHGIFENGIWRRSWINIIRKENSLKPLDLDEQNHCNKINSIIESLTDVFEENINLGKILDS